MTNSLLWSPKNHITSIERFSKKVGNFLTNLDYNTLHSWSIKNKNEFWSEFWDFSEIIGEKKGPVIENEKNFIESIFFKNCKLNFTENILKKNDDSDAIVFYSEKGNFRKLSWRKLNEQISKISHYFKNNDINQGDRIVGVLPNIPETVISFLASAKIGAIWSSCSSDFGPKAIIERFKQINPKILIISDYYFYNNKKIETLSKIKEIKKSLINLNKIIIIPYDGKKINYVLDFKYDNWLEILDKSLPLTKYEKFDFNIPLYILYSSGTTGVPKCIVHGAGGSLIQHKKEHLLHMDIRENDKVFYFTTCGWMMWNWLVSCLASKSTIVLYDGSPFYPRIEYLFEIAEKEKITFFGTGAKYLDHLKQHKVNIRENYKLEKLKTIASTGSPLVHETFQYVYGYINKNVHLASISGGTDIVSCFVTGNPNMPVYSGEIQCKALGMEVDIFDEEGNTIINKKGELVCKSSFPSKPLFFWNDKENKKYLEAYFTKYPNIWHHGDFAELTSKNGYIIYGRSDSTLNAGGIRIGTAEIYRVVENINGIIECVAVEQKHNNDTRVILFIKLDSNSFLDEKLNENIKYQIKNQLSPKHIPSKIIQVHDIPKTKSGKLVELTIKKIVNNEEIDNLSSLSNPECLIEFKNKLQLLN